MINPDAFNDFCNGKKTREIAAKYNVSKTTVRSWISREQWRPKKSKYEQEKRKKRRERIEHFEQSLFDEISEQSKEIVQALLKNVKITLDISNDAGTSVYQGSDPEHDLDAAKKVMELAKGAAQTFRQTVPEFGDDLAEMMLKQLQRREDEHNLEKYGFKGKETPREVSKEDKTEDAS